MSDEQSDDQFQPCPECGHRWRAHHYDGRCHYTALWRSVGDEQDDGPNLYALPTKED